MDDSFIFRKFFRFGNNRDEDDNFGFRDDSFSNGFPKASPFDVFRDFSNLFKHLESMDFDDFEGLPDNNNTEAKADLPPWKQMLKPEEWKDESKILPPSMVLKDVDLDSQIEKRGWDIDKLPERGVISGAEEKNPKGFSKQYGFSSSSFSKRIISNGKYEEHKKIRDSQGNEETIITRKLGDQAHTLKTKITAKGEEEKVEGFENFSPEQLEEFNNKWSGQQQSMLQQPPALQQPNMFQATQLPFYKRILDRFF